MTLPTLTIVDDDVDMAALLKEVASDMGFPVRVFHDGSEFQENIGQLGQVIVLDLMMPGVDGVEVIRMLASQDCTASLILISGHDRSVLHSAQQLAQEHRLNVAGTLSKPIHMAEFRLLLSGLNIKPATSKQFQQEKVTELDENALIQAIDKQQLILYYQPQINIKNRTLSGVEGLIRWNHPTRGLVLPYQIMPLVEKHGLMGKLTEVVIKQAVEQSLQWQQAGLRLRISVNVSADNITSLTLPEQLSDLILSKKLDPSILQLEITENALMKKLVTSLDILTRLRLKGFTLSIDDFGTGYSSLSQLHRVPFTELKIDKNFIMNMADDDEAVAIVETCIMLGHKLNMSVVAEGVEDQAILEKLVQLNCDIAQGYYISKPMPAEKLFKWQKARNLVKHN